MERRVVLIAEDEVEIRELLAMLFEAEGFTVLQAADGQLALNLVRENRDRIVLLVTDLGLPKLGGVDLISEARALIPSLKVIAASGYGHADVRAELLNIGVEEFFPKPFSPIELLATAKLILGGV